jgi:hypothetical protein
MVCGPLYRPQIPIDQELTVNKELDVCDSGPCLCNAVRETGHLSFLKGNLISLLRYTVLHSLKNCPPPVQWREIFRSSFERPSRKIFKYVSGLIFKSVLIYRLLCACFYAQFILFLIKKFYLSLAICSINITHFAKPYCCSV